jgi:hypothetical protein
MKLLDVSPITDTAQFPIKKGTLQFLQDAYKENFTELITALLGGVGGYPYVFNGMLNLGTGLDFNITSGTIYDPTTQEVFLCDGAAFTASLGQTAVISIVTTQYTTDADPVTFTDATTKNVHNIRKVTITAGTPGGAGTANYVADYNNLVFGRMEIPLVASQGEVNTGTNELKIVTPLTLAGWFAGKFGAWTKDSAATNWSYFGGGGGSVTFTNTLVDYKIVGKTIHVNFAVSFNVVSNSVGVIKYTFSGVNRLGLRQVLQSCYLQQGATKKVTALTSVQPLSPFEFQLNFDADATTTFPVGTGYLMQGEFTVEIL